MKVLFILMFSLLALGCDRNQEQPLEVSQTITTPDTEEKTTTKAARATSGNIFEYGIYNPQRKGRVLGSLTTNTGKVVSKSVLELSETTDRIPLIKDTYFAYRFRIIGIPKEQAKKPALEFRKVLTHPVMTLPDGSTSTGWDRTAKGRTSIGQIIAFDGYAFNEDYELVEGEWTFQIWYGDKMMVEQKFTTYHPEAEGAETKTVAPAAES